MKKSGQETNMFGMPMPAMELMQPQAILESCGKMAAQVEDLSRTMTCSMQRTMESAWDLSAEMARNPSDATRLCREWMDERRDAFFVEGKQISNMWFKLFDLRPAPAVGSTAPLSSLSRAASAAE